MKLNISKSMLILSLMLSWHSYAHAQIADPEQDSQVSEAPIVPTQEEMRLLVLINAFRAYLSLSQLQPDSRLQASAAGHSEWLSQHFIATGGVPVHWGPSRTTHSRARMIFEGLPRDGRF